MRPAVKPRKAIGLTDAEIENERCVLGSMMVASRCVPVVKQILPIHQMFALPSHRLIASAIYALSAEGAPIDLVTVKTQLTQDGALADAGGEDYLIQIAELVPSAGNSRWYAGVVRESYAHRHIERRCGEIIAMRQAGAPFSEVWSAAQKLCRGRLMPNQFAFEPSSEFDEAILPDGVLTGFAALDDMTSMSGLPRGQMTVLGASTGTGKSLLAQQITMTVARRGSRVAYLAFGSDLSARSLQARWCKQQVGIFPRRTLASADLDRVNEVYLGMADLRILMYEGERAEDGTIETAIEWLLHESKFDPFDLVVFDYAQIIRTQKQFRSRIEQMEEVSAAVSRSAVPLNAAVMLVSQLASKDSDEFRYSQQFEHDSALALVLSVDEVELLNGTHDAKLKIKKNRWGYRGDLQGVWNPRFLRFEGWRT